MRGGAKLKGADHSMLSRASNPEALGFLSGEVSLASKPEELLIAIAHRCRKLIIIMSVLDSEELALYILKAPWIL